MVTFDVDVNRILNISTSDHHQQVELHHDHQRQGLLVKCAVNEVEKYKCNIFTIRDTFLVLLRLLYTSCEGVWCRSFV